MVQRENNSWDMYRYMYISNETCYSVYVSYFSFLFIDNLMDNLLFSSISVIISRRREYFYFVHRFFSTFLQIGDSYFSIAFLELFYLDLIAFFFFYNCFFFFSFYTNIKILTFPIEKMSIFHSTLNLVNQEQFWNFMTYVLEDTIHFKHFYQY